MNEIQKIAQWVQRFEDHLTEMRERKTATEKRIALKVLRMTRQASEGGLDAANTLVKLRRLERIASEGEMTQEALEQVEKEVDALKGDQSKNETFYPSRGKKALRPQEHYHHMTLEEAQEAADETYGDQSLNESFYPSRGASPGHPSMSLEDARAHAEETYGDQSKNETFYPRRESSELRDELERLTTYEHEDVDAAWDGTFDQGHGAVRNLTAEMLREAFEDDGEFIDQVDMLDVNMPSFHTENAPMPLDKNFPLGKHDWRDDLEGDRPVPRLEPVMARALSTYDVRKAFVRTANSSDLLSYLMRDHGSRCLDDESDVMAVLGGLRDMYRLSGEAATKVRRVLQMHSSKCLDNRVDAAAVANALMKVL